MSNSEWQGVVQQLKMTESKWIRKILSFKMKQKANLVPEEFCSIFYAIYKHYILSNIDNL